VNEQSARRAAFELLSLAWRADRARTALVLGLGLVAAFNGSLQGLWLKLIIDAVTRHQRGLAIAATVALGSSLAVYSLTFLGANFLRMRIVFAASDLAVGRMMELALELPGIEHLERSDYLDRMKLLREQVPAMIDSAWRLLDLALAALRVLIISALLASVHPALLLLAAFVLPTVWNTAVAHGRMTTQNEALAQDERHERYLFELATTAAPAKELRVFGLEDTIKEMRRQAYEAVKRARVRAAVRSQLRQSLSTLVFAVGFVGAVLFVAVQASARQATVGDVLLAFTAGAQLRGQLGGLAQLTTQGVNALRGLAHHLWLLDYAAANVERIDEPAEPPVRLRDGITLRNVDFAYPGSTASVLAGLNLHLPAGSVVAIVGENGAGKTTIVKLLTRMYEPSAGGISIDGIPLSRIPATAWRARVATGFQDFVRFELIARETVGIGNVRHLGDDVSIGKALARAGGAAVIDRLPDGLSTQLGRRFEGGVELSGGQWQKLALSRAMMPEEPLLLVLDEPTSGLDAAAEYELFESQARVARELSVDTGTVTLLISHRFSTVRTADLIVVLRGNRVDAIGTHDALVAEDGFYAELYRIQRRSYR
jgi:ABC-type multidrug transport system fused ATPase/permease subunit